MADDPRDDYSRTLGVIEAITVVTQQCPSGAVRACAELDIEVLTLYAFSVENWSRPRAEVNGLMQVLKDTLRREQAELDENGVQLRTIGRESDLPPDVRRQLDKTRRALEHNDGLVLNLALSYGGRPEIVDAAKALVKDALRLRRGGDPLREQIGAGEGERDSVELPELVPLEVLAQFAVRVEANPVGQDEPGLPGQGVQGHPVFGMV